MNETIDLKTEVQELAWAMIEEQATDSEVRRLEELLLNSAEARQTYVRCMQMHADLHYLLGGKSARRPAVGKRNNPKKTTKAARTLQAIGLPTSTDVPLCNGSLS